MHLARFPRARFAHLPTPLEPLPRLSARLGEANLLVKRDDCTGLATGGNKTRKLEFLLGDALELGADTVITQGAVQSNHVRQTAAAAARLGLRCLILLEERTAIDDPDYRESGNVLLDYLLGALVEYRPAGCDMDAEMDAAAERLREDGAKPYVIPGGGSNPVGALGYVNCVLELLAQATDAGVALDAIVHATGSAGTQAGLVTGLAACNADIPVLGICVSRPAQQQEANVFELAQAVAVHIGAPGCVDRTRVVANGDYVGEGYGIPTDAMLEAVTLAAAEEGLLLDPVYTGKAMAGLIDLVRRGEYAKQANVVFLHTGGSAALFAYRGALTGHLVPSPHARERQTP